jgi:hypothetical protein
MNFGNIENNMKVSLPIEEGYFNITPDEFCGLYCWLITPEIDAKWNKNNLFYRSLIVDREGNVLSSGWPKFFNYGEKPDCYPNPEQYNDWKYEEKKDGSLLIADFINDQFSMRTRGTVSYVTQENAKDFELLPKKYPAIVDFLKENQHLSLLFEIVTPNNVIVIRSPQIEFYFLGAINKNSMEIVSSSDLLEIWRRILININWLYKKKGTRDAIQFIFKLLGAPECLLRFDELGCV